MEDCGRVEFHWFNDGRWKFIRYIKMDEEEMIATIIKNKSCDETKQYCYDFMGSNGVLRGQIYSIHNCLV